MDLDDIIAAERAACPDTSMEAWRHRCEVFHYARIEPLARKARFNQMLALGRAPEQVRILEDSVAALCAELGLHRPSPGAAANNAATASPAPTNSRPAAQGAPWTPELDRALLRLAGSGKSHDELAAHFGRSIRAIEMRLARLERERLTP